MPGKEKMLDATLHASVAIFFVDGKLSILCPFRISDNEGHSTNVISGRHLPETF